jgi:lysophospholipase L1-like esterase
MFTLKTNSLGLREREIAPGAPKKGSRILLLGDSMSMAEGSEYDELYIKKLEGLLEEKGPSRAETINAAIRGYGNDQELILFRRVKEMYKPGVVILAFYTGNDLEDNWDGQLFRLENGKLTQQPASAETSKKFRYYAVQARAQNFPGYGFIMGKSHAANWARVTYSRILQKRIYKSDRPAGAAVPFSDQPAFRLTVAILAQWKQEVRDIKALPYILIIPKRDDVRKLRIKTGPEPQRLDLEIEAFCRRENIPCLNLTPRMIAMKDGFEELWLSCGHLSPRGHSWVADRLYDDLGPRKLLSK